MCTYFRRPYLVTFTHIQTWTMARLLSRMLFSYAWNGDEMMKHTILSRLYCGDDDENGDERNRRGSFHF